MSCTYHFFARWLDLLLSRVVYYTKAFLQNSTRDREERWNRMTDILVRLLLLEERQQMVLDDLQKYLQKTVLEALIQLKNYLNSASVKADFCQWSLNEVPQAESSWVVTMSSVKKCITSRLQNIIKAWEEKEGAFARCRESLKSYFLKKYGLFEEQLQNLESEVVTESRAGDKKQAETADLNAEVLPVEAKLMIGVTSPIWIPLGIVALVVRVPAFGVMAIKAKVEEKRRIKMYTDDPCSFMENESKRFLEKVSSNFDELTNFVKAQMVDAIVCLKQIEACIPELIQADKQLCEKLKDEARSQKKIFQLYNPILEKSKELQGDLGMLTIREIRPLELSPENVAWKEESENLLGRGAFAGVYRGKLRQRKEPKVVDIAVKAYNDVLTKHNVVQFLAEEDALRYVFTKGNVKMILVNVYFFRKILFIFHNLQQSI